MIYIVRQKEQCKSTAHKMIMKLLKLIPGADPIKLFFLRFPIFAVKLGHFIVDTFLSYLPNTQAYQQKTEKFFASEEK